MSSFFDYDMKCASPYVHLRKHYGHDGIIALIPSRLSEKEFGNAYRFSAMIEFLDFLRPELHGEFLRFCSRVVDSMFRGQKIPDDRLDRLDLGWIDPGTSFPACR